MRNFAFKYRAKKSQPFKFIIKTVTMKILQVFLKKGGNGI